MHALVTVLQPRRVRKHSQAGFLTIIDTDLEAKDPFPPILLVPTFSSETRRTSANFASAVSAEVRRTFRKVR